MNPKLLIEKLLTAGVLLEDLVELSPGADDDDINDADKRFASQLDSGYKQFLNVWNGANLDVVRLFSTSDLNLKNGLLIFANDPSGIRYHMNTQGEIISEDTDGGETKIVASSFNDFFYSYLFGDRSHEFMGPEWKQELKDAGIST